VPAGAGDREPLDHRAVPEVAHSEPPCDRREHVAVLAHVLEGHERDPVEPIACEARDLECQAGLADTTGAHEGDQPAAVALDQPLEQRRDLSVAPDDVGRRPRERLHRRDVLGLRARRT
jgi:hypothetical protein